MQRKTDKLFSSTKYLSAITMGTLREYKLKLVLELKYSSWELKCARPFERS